MTKAQLRKAVIARLWELCDGADPSICWEGGPYGGEVVGGICPDIEMVVDGNERLDMNIPDGPGRCMVMAALREMGMEDHNGHGLGLAFPAEDWGNGRRLLCGFLALWLGDQK